MMNIIFLMSVLILCTFYVSIQDKFYFNQSSSLPHLLLKINFTNMYEIYIKHYYA